MVWRSDTDKNKYETQLSLLQVKATDIEEKLSKWNNLLEDNPEMIVELDGRISELQNQQIMNQEEQNQLKRQKAQEGESIKVYVAAYSSEKGIIEEASEISVDLSILENSLLREVIDSESEIGGKSGLKFYQNKDGEDESDKDDVNVGDDNDDSDDQDESTGKETNFGEDITEKEKIEKKFKIIIYEFCFMPSWDRKSVV